MQKAAMRLRHLEVFNAVMDIGSLTGAGTALGISQSSVSKVLQHFELQLGMDLFIRKSGKLSPTPEARRLFQDSAQLVARLNTVRRVAATFEQAGQRVVRVVATPSLAAALLPEALGAWRRDHPQEHCELSSFHTSEMVSRLLLGEADFGLTLHNPGHAGLDARSLAEHHMLFAAPPGTWSVAQCRTALPIASISTEVVGIAATDPLGALVQAVADTHAPGWSCWTVAQTHQLAAALAAAGHGLALVDPFTARAMPVQTRASLPRIPVSLWLLSRKEVAHSRSTLGLIAALEHCARKA